MSLNSLDPEQICRTALYARGVPESIVKELKPGRLMDAWVHMVVMMRMPWQQAQAAIDRAREEILKEQSKEVKT